MHYLTISKKRKSYQLLLHSHYSYIKKGIVIQYEN